MQPHRSTQARVSNDPQLSNFEPGTALENLRAEMIDIEDAGVDDEPKRSVPPPLPRG